MLNYNREVPPPMTRVGAFSHGLCLKGRPSARESYSAVTVNLTAGRILRSPSVHSFFRYVFTLHGWIRKGNACRILPESKHMETVTLRAHFDGERILLDQPFELEPDTKLIVNVLPKSLDEEREEWAQLALE